MDGLHLVLLDELDHGGDLPGVHIPEGDEGALAAGAGEGGRVAGGLAGLLTAGGGAGLRLHLLRLQGPRAPPPSQAPAAPVPAALQAGHAGQAEEGAVEERGGGGGGGGGGRGWSGGHLPHPAIPATASRVVTMRGSS